ncbi:ATP-binding cassette sub-family C member 4-like isoform X1 [Centruroides vittatus]|uniref:ATP-binding cassette sub-family C member 4-like isoform X1 n=1 Tax=Centruroides vittatus TaxID=120091 RepID=UPI00351002B0
MEVETLPKINPYESASVFSRMFYCWLYPLFMKGYKTELEVNDLYQNPKTDCSEKLGDRLQKQWDKELKKKHPSLLKAVIRTFGCLYFLHASLILVEECIIRVCQPYLLGVIVDYYANKNKEKEFDSYLSAGGICLLAVCFVFTHHVYFFGAQRIGMRIRIACCSIIYRKALKLSHTSLGKTTVGQMVNLLSNDVNRFDYCIIYLPHLIAGPLQTAIMLLVLWRYLGYATFAGLAILLLYIPFQGGMGKLFSKLRSKTAKLTDERIRLMNEIVAGMRVIKMYTWEFAFANLVDKARRKEIKKIRQTSILRGINIALFFVSSKLILFLSFLTYILLGGQLTARTVFVSISLFNNLRLCMTLFFPYGISQGAEALISLKRLQRFLLLEEQEENEMTVSSLRPKLNQCGVWMSKLTASWNKDGEATLQRITLNVQPGELLAVIGPVGSGKTSLLMSMLGELPSSSGEIKVKGKIAYASQEAWVFGGSVKQNILFGDVFDEEKYNNVLHVSALEKDINLFPYGDRTLVGERGVSLSGGQKARVNLARALYLDADIFILDDPLSAVDAAVAKHIFEKCIMQYLKNKVRILATHQIQFLKKATKIIVLKEGKCLALGTYDELVTAGIDVGSLIEENEEIRSRKNTTGSFSSADEDVIISNPQPAMLYESNSSLATSEFEGEPVRVGDDKSPKQQQETKTAGAVGAAVYKSYIKAGSGPFLQILLLLSYVATQTLFNGSDYWLSKWTDEEQVYIKEKQIFDNYTKYNNDTNDTMNLILPPRNFNMYVYSGLIWGLFLLSLVRTIAFFTMCMKASINLHNNMFNCIIRAPIAFFDNNPVGAILNRCSRDLGMIDDLLPPCASDCIEIFCNMLGILVLVAIINYYLIAPTIVLAIMFIFIRRFFIATARDIKRLEGITRSPVFSHLTTSLYGLATIRAFRCQRTFEIAFDKYQDRHTSAWFLFLAITRWFGIHLDWLCVLYIVTVTVGLILAPGLSLGGEIGLAISSALALSGSFQWGVRQSAEVESQMTSVERVLEYSRLPSEAALRSSPDKRPPPDWPNKGMITFDDVSLQYSENDPPVLKNLNWHVKPQEKVGIVGRTGAGKSSMIATLFRMTEPTGTVYIDNIATSEIGLHELRNKISIIPQDPVLFTGPVRRNIDPFSEHIDETLWKVLEDVHLKDAVQELQGGLDAELSEGGSNFSVGQRQLICLARAILRQNKILVLDEATANVDPKTDSLIQETIREKFASCTVLTIAHRLHTIMDSDRVLVLDAGRIQEFDEPYELLKNKSGSFYNMVQMTGGAMSRQLYEIAKQTYYFHKRRNKISNKEENNKNNVFGGLGGENNVIVMNGIDFEPPAYDTIINPRDSFALEYGRFDEEVTAL